MPAARAGRHARQLTWQNLGQDVVERLGDGGAGAGADLSAGANLQLLRLTVGRSGDRRGGDDGSGEEGNLELHLGEVCGLGGVG